MTGYRNISTLTLTGMAVFAYWLQLFLLVTPAFSRWHAAKYEAAQLMERAVQTIQTACRERQISIDPDYDSNRTGLIGPERTPITTDLGSFNAKLMTTNPSMAAVVVEMLRQAGVDPGDQVAVAVTGSMPGANIAVLAACEVLKLKPLIISSVGASNYGANRPELTWLDMETILQTEGVFRHRSIAASLGGTNDRADELPAAAKQLMRDAAARNNVPLIEGRTIQESVSRRLALYQERADRQPIKVFINVGGNVASLGVGLNRKRIPSGLSLRLNSARLQSRSVMTEMAEKMPVIHILDVYKLAAKYGLSRYPVPPPPIGTEKIFIEQRYSVSLTTALVCILIIGLILADRLDWLVRTYLEERQRSRRLHPSTRS